MGVSGFKEGGLRGHRHILLLHSNIIVHKKAFESDSLHVSQLGSGSHSPFSAHVAELDPLSSSPGGQLKLTVRPSTGITYPTMSGT